MDNEDAARNHMSRYSAIHHQTNSSSHRRKPPIHNTTTYAQQHHVSTNYSDHGEDDDEPEEEEEEEDEEEEDTVISDDDNHDGVAEGSERYQKKRKWKGLPPGYEFPPRVAAPSGEWTEHTSFLLLDVWGDRFLQNGRKSLRSEEWQEVANKVSQVVGAVTTDTQCRSRLDSLKKKYKKEKIKLEEIGNYTSKWRYFKKMDKLMSSSLSKQHELSCGFDSGEYVFMNPNVYLNCSSGLDEMRDSPENSESSDGLPPKKGKIQGNGDEGNSFRLLANSIQKFGEIHERIEENKMQQMQELEKMRIEFHRDLELQKRQILEHTQAEIEKIQQSYDDDDDDDDEIDVSAENLSE